MTRLSFRAKRLWSAAIGLVLAVGRTPAAELPAGVEPVVAAPAVNCVDDVTGCVPGLRVDAEYLLWWSKAAPLPAPVLTLGDTSNLGVLGRPGTSVLAGGGDAGFGPASGARFTVGSGLGDRQDVGVEGSYVFLGRQSNVRSFASDAGGSPVLSVPFVQVGGAAQTNPIFTPTQQGETSTQVSAPGKFAGAAVVAWTTELQGAELNAVSRLAGRDGWHVDVLGGLRYLDLRESFTFDTSSPGINPPSVFVSRDEFGAQNHFYGGQFGARVEHDTGAAFLALTSKVALGSMQERVRVSGGVVTNDLNNFGPPQAFPGGYFAQPTNIGVYHRGAFAVVPEVGLSAGYCVTTHTRLTVGYNFLYLSDVARPGSQLDRAINALQAPGISGNPPQPLVGPARPAFEFRTDDFWAHGLSFGLEWRY